MLPWQLFPTLPPPVSPAETAQRSEQPVQRTLDSDRRRAGRTIILANEYDLLYSTLEIISMLTMGKVQDGGSAWPDYIDSTVPRGLGWGLPGWTCEGASGPGPGMAAHAHT